MPFISQPQIEDIFYSRFPRLKHQSFILKEKEYYITWHLEYPIYIYIKEEIFTNIKRERDISRELLLAKLERHIAFDVLKDI